MRELFWLDPEVTFLNHGSYGACPREVLHALHEWQRTMERNPVEFLGRRSAALLAAARARWAAELNAPADDIAFVANATTGVNVVARSLALQPGDEVLTTDHEYGACVEAWKLICRERGATFRAVAIPLPFERETFVERLLAAASPQTRVVYASHITSTTALVFPVAELCAAARERGLVSVIDGAHAPGHVTLDLAAIGADFYTGNGHKWLCGPKGAAFLCVRPEHQPRIAAPVISWGYAAEVSGHTGFDAYTGRTALERRLLWQGTRDVAAWLALPAAIEFQARHDWPAVRARCHALLADTLHAWTRRFGLPAASADTDFGQMAVLPVPHTDAERLRRRLWEESRIEIPVTQHGGRAFVRLSLQGYNTPADVERLLAAPALADY
jgi:isopenicillin-N epimerase